MDLLLWNINKRGVWYWGVKTGLEAKPIQWKKQKTSLREKNTRVRRPKKVSLENNVCDGNTVTSVLYYKRRSAAILQIKPELVAYWWISFWFFSKPGKKGLPGQKCKCW